jgi:hypothetical protein
MIDTWITMVSAGGAFVVIITLFVRIEHRLTKVETLVRIIGLRLSICRHNSDDDIT